MFGAFFVQMLISILFIVAKDSLIQKVIEGMDFKDDNVKKQEFIDTLNKNINAVFGALIFFTIILVSLKNKISNKIYS